MISTQHLLILPNVAMGRAAVVPDMDVVDVEVELVKVALGTHQNLGQLVSVQSLWLTRFARATSLVVNQATAAV